ncbi:MAG: hypothetical protein ACFBRM_04560 [Pikeienuella sp.]
MIRVDDLIDMCGVTREELEAVAEHEHLPEVAAAALTDYLLHLPQGPAIVRGMIRDDIRAAIRRGDASHARRLIWALHHFVTTHPTALHQGH